MKVRIGVSLGSGAEGPSGFAAAVDRLEELGIDSLWLSEMVYSDLIEPFIGMAYALARTSKLKVGTGVAVLPGRHPVPVAKQLVSLAALAPGRVLPVFGLQPARREELDAFPLLPPRDGSVKPVRRGETFDESLELLTRLLREESVTWEGRTLEVHDARIRPRPVKPLDVWLGGSAPAALRRIGRLADGWLGSFLSPSEAGAARQAIEAAAAEAGRTVDPDHFGMSLPVALGEIPAPLLAVIRDRRPDVDPADLIAQGWAGCQELIRRYVDEGISKFVIRSSSPETSSEEFLTGFTTHLSPLQT